MLLFVIVFLLLFEWGSLVFLFSFFSLHQIFFLFFFSDFKSIQPRFILQMFSFNFREYELSRRLCMYLGNICEYNFFVLRVSWFACWWRIFFFKFRFEKLSHCLHVIIKFRIFDLFFSSLVCVQSTFTWEKRKEKYTYTSWDSIRIYIRHLMSRILTLTISDWAKRIFIYLFFTSCADEEII